jgi:hypothetical protein
MPIFQNTDKLLLLLASCWLLVFHRNGGEPLPDYMALNSRRTPPNL